VTSTGDCAGYVSVLSTPDPNKVQITLEYGSDLPDSDLLEIFEMKIVPHAQDAQLINVETTAPRGSILLATLQESMPGPQTLPYLMKAASQASPVLLPRKVFTAVVPNNPPQARYGRSGFFSENFIEGKASSQGASTRVDVRFQVGKTVSPTIGHFRVNSSWIIWTTMVIQKGVASVVVGVWPSVGSTQILLGTFKVANRYWIQHDGATGRDWIQHDGATGRDWIQHDGATGRDWIQHDGAIGRGCWGG